MKNKGKSYMDRFADAQDDVNQADEDLRSAKDKKKNVEDSAEPKKPAPTKIYDKIIDIAVGALKEDTARLERSNNRNVSVMSMIGG